MITIQGKGVSAGVGVGPLYFYRRATAEIKRYTVEDTDAEWHRFKGAQTGAIEQLGVLAEQARKEAGDEAAMLFETHQMMAEDLDYEEAIEDRIVNQKMNAEAAVSDTSEQFAEMFASMDDAYMQARAADVKDVSQRILGILCGIVQGGIASDVPVLLCADDLAPSETIQLDKSKVLGFITAGGSGSSHTAILARTLGIPAIVGMGDALKPELEGRAAIADGSTGALVIDPDDDTRDRLLKKRDEQLRLQRLLETLKGQANVTKDGKTIRIYCNIGSPEDVHAVQVNDGGVLRLGSGFGSLTGTPYTEDGVQKTGNMILLNGGGVLGMLDADWSNENEMVVNAGGKAFVLDTTGYDPDSMTASGNSHVMTLNGTVKLGGASGTIIVKNGNAGKNGRVVLGAANTWDGVYQVTDHAALELAHAGALNTKAGVELQGAGFSRFFRRSGNRAGSRLRGPRPVQRRQRERQDGSGAGPYGILRLRAGGGRRAGGPRDGQDRKSVV